MGEDDAGTLARLAGVAHPMRDVSDELDAARNRSSWQHF
jgi:Na+/H+-translocating membrane pyrophosphatase